MSSIMTNISVTIKALNDTRDAVETYAREIADVVTSVNGYPVGKWSDEHQQDYQNSITLLIQTVVEVSNSSQALATRLQKKAELVAENMRYEV